MLELCQARLQRLQANAPSIEAAFNYNDAAVRHQTCNIIASALISSMNQPHDVVEYSTL